MSPERKSQWRGIFYGACLIFLFVLFQFMGKSKFSTLSHVQTFNPADDTALFWTENAFHYRYAKMAASGAGIPAVDRRMQYPEGMHVLRDEMPMMERFVGYAYRRFASPAVPFHVFLMILACFYSSAVLFPAFLLSAFVWKNPLAGVFTVLLYSFTYSFMGSVVLGSFIRQDFVLPFLFMGTFVQCAGLEKKNGWLSALAGLLLAFSFVSWHMAQFYYLVFLLGLVVLYFLQRDARASIFRSVSIVTVLLLAASVLFLPLRASLFPLSLLMLTSYALMAQHLVFRLRRTGPEGSPRVEQARPLQESGASPVGAQLAEPAHPSKAEPLQWKRPVLFLLILGALTAAAVLFAGEHYGQYSHVYRLVIDKLKFLGVKPADPARLSFESRVMWTSSFLSPGLGIMFSLLAAAWLAGAAGAATVVVRTIRTRTLPITSFLLLWMAAAFIALFALIQRMDVFAAFFLCVLAGAIAPRKPFSAKGVALLAILCALVGFNYRYLGRLYMVNMTPPQEPVKSVLKFIRENTGKDDVILAQFPFSPVICAYTDRPVILHSKFENSEVREKVREFYAALYAPEQEFYGFCKKYDVQYFVFEPAMVLDTAQESVRYVADRMKLGKNSTAVLMQFLPAALQRFQLVYQSPNHRVYRVLSDNETTHPTDFPPLPIYDSHGFKQDELKIW